MKEILLLIYELLDVKYAFTDCGGDLNTDKNSDENCSPCAHYHECKNAYERKEKGDELKKLINLINEK